jgi:Protein of unknown function DUF262
MANIYEEKSEPLHQLLDRARSDDGATVLIPDLQRPYVWTPNQVALLIDSMIRGWPFGTLLMWKIGQGEIQNIPHRQFWRVVDSTQNGSGSAITRKDPPASYHMVLDGQQRVQSLLLALGGDSWGFKMEDRVWAEELHERRPRGRQGKYRHWSKASLCFDLDQFLMDYGAGGGLLAVDFRNVLRWVITDPADGQSKWSKPQNYEEPLSKASEPALAGRFIRLSRLWSAVTPNPNIKEAGFREIVRSLFESEGIPAAKTEESLTPMGELMTTLRDVKLSKVTYLELVPFDKHIWTEDSYNDAIVNIFTRLNTAGRTLTREEITLAWLKVGWEPAATGGKTAGECFEQLLKDLSDRGLTIAMDDLVNAVSVVWAVTHNEGKLLENRDLLKGHVIRPMANALATDWAQISRAILECTEAVSDRNLEYGPGAQYASLNALVVLWAWYFLAVSWEEIHGLKETPRDDFEKKYRATLDAYVDRWLIASQWSGRWAESSNRAMSSYVNALNADAVVLNSQNDLDRAHKALEERLNALVSDIVDDATKHVDSVTAPSRERVSIYRNVLWVWHRLEKERWKMSQIQLRTGRSKKTSLDVDHTVAYAMWEKKLVVGLPDGFTEPEEAQSIVNRLGNCSLLEKSFNVSKSDKTLKSFMEAVHEIKEKKVALEDWAKTLLIEDAMLDPSGVTANAISKAIEDRDQLIRKEVVDFVKGIRSRIDLEN